MSDPHYNLGLAESAKGPILICCDCRKSAQGNVSIVNEDGSEDPLCDDCHNKLEQEEKQS